MSSSCKRFDFENRLTTDTCAQNVKDGANREISNYNLYNYYGDCENASLQKLAAECPNLHFKNGFGYTNACTIDLDSAMRFQVQTHGQERRQLNARPFTAVPNMGRGCLIPDVESYLLNGQDTTIVRECNRISEANFDRFTPLIGCVKNYIDGFSANNYFPTGVDSRETMRRKLKESATCAPRSAI